jgi:putative ABC transport system permease protein
VAAPFAWYIMQVWLDCFAFRISIIWWHIALAGVAALLITFFTVALQSIRAVLSNPVESLRYEYGLAFLLSVRIFLFSLAGRTGEPQL